MKLVLGSDFHGYLPKHIPKGDVMILAGDILPSVDVHSFVRNELNPWLLKAPVYRTILIWGNHDWQAFNGLVGVFYATVLIEESVVIRGVKIYGSPWSLPFERWAWMAPEVTLEKIYREIPDDVDIIVSHTPPYGVCDKAGNGSFCGSQALLKRINSLSNLKLVVCGHVHEAKGRNGVVVNVSSVYNMEGYCIPRPDPWTIVDI
jgi:Icc-related predicted phosphoesterase